MTLDTTHASKQARAQCEELERQAKAWLDAGYKLNELEIVSFQSDGRKEVWPKSLVKHTPQWPIVFKDFFIPDSQLPFEMKTEAGQAAARSKPPLLIEQLKWDKQVPWVNGHYWCRYKSSRIPSLLKFRVSYGPEPDGDIAKIEHLGGNGVWYETPATSWEFAGPILEPIS